MRVVRLQFRAVVARVPPAKVSSVVAFAALFMLVVLAWSVVFPPRAGATIILADLAITKTDGVTTAVPGTSTTYFITVSNAGPSGVTGASVSDPLPAGSTAMIWTATGATGGGTVTGPTSGTGALATTVDLPVGSTVSFSATPAIDQAATGSLTNTATISPPAGVTDPTPGNNSATDTDTLTPQADLAITKTDGVTSATPGGSVTYTITASNAGPSNAPGATVADIFPAELTVTWTCVGAGGGTCTASGSGNIIDPVNLPAGGSVTYTASAAIDPGATGTLSNTATVAPPVGVTDPNPGNNAATDTDTLIPGTTPTASSIPEPSATLTSTPEIPTTTPATSTSTPEGPTSTPISPTSTPASPAAGENETPVNTLPGTGSGSGDINRSSWLFVAAIAMLIGAAAIGLRRRQGSTRIQ
ncbi:MAG: DUF11 domain-containing protein [Thermomicrobiales bacterium]